MFISKMIGENIEPVMLLEREIFSDPWTETAFYTAINNPLYESIVAKEGEQIVGYLIYSYIPPEGEIQRIAVRTGFQKRGIGTALMENIVLFSKEQEVTAITLEVRAGNRAARNLYEHCGFVKEGVRKGYYQGPQEDAVIMWNRRI